MVGAILICGTILIICVSNLRNHRNQSGGRKQIITSTLSLTNIIDPNRYFNVCNLKKAGIKRKFGYALNMQFGREIFTLSPVAYMASEFKKLVSYLFHIRIVAKHNSTSKAFHMQYRST